MARKRKARKLRGKRKYYPHIYFESKKIKGRDAVYPVVQDVGEPGVKSAKEVKELCIAQLVDWLDGYTVDHYGNVIKFSEGTWSGRTKILYRLAYRFGGVQYVKKMVKLKRELEEMRDEMSYRQFISKALRLIAHEFKISPAKVRKIHHIVNRT